MTYNVSITNSSGKTIFNYPYDDNDGILDVELVPTPSKNVTQQQFTTWGPDFTSQEAFRTAGTFHIKGSVLVQSIQCNYITCLRGQSNIPKSNF